MYDKCKIKKIYILIFFYRGSYCYLLLSDMSQNKFDQTIGLLQNIVFEFYFFIVFNFKITIKRHSFFHHNQ